VPHCAGSSTPKPLNLCHHLRNDIDNGATIVSELGTIVVAQNFDFSNRILANRHTDLVRATWLAAFSPSIEATVERPRWPEILGQVGAKLPRQASMSSSLEVAWYQTQQRK